VCQALEIEFSSLEQHGDRIPEPLIPKEDATQLAWEAAKPINSKSAFAIRNEPRIPSCRDRIGGAKSNDPLRFLREPQTLIFDVPFTPEEGIKPKEILCVGGEGDFECDM
jgi:hypothetical protein